MSNQDFRQVYDQRGKLHLIAHPHMVTLCTARAFQRYGRRDFAGFDTSQFKPLRVAIEGISDRLCQNCLRRTKQNDISLRSDGTYSIDDEEFNSRTSQVTEEMTAWDQAFRESKTLEELNSHYEEAVAGQQYDHRRRTLYNWYSDAKKKKFHS